MAKKQREIPEATKSSSQPASKGAIWAILIILGFIGIVIVIIVVASNGFPTPKVIEPICKDVQVPYEVSEEYNETVPYSAEQCENAQLKYLIEWGSINTVCLNEICDAHEQYCVEKNFWGNCVKYAERCTHNACTKYQTSCNVKIDNIDDEAGTWSIEGYSWNQDINQRGDFVGTINTYVNPTKSGIASWNIVYNAGESRACWYSISNIPTKSICENVIKNKDVPKTRTVVKYKTEQQCS